MSDGSASFLLFVRVVLLENALEVSSGRTSGGRHPVVKKTSCRPHFHCANWSCSVTSDSPPRRIESGRDWRVKRATRRMGWIQTLRRIAPEIRRSGRSLLGSRPPNCSAFSSLAPSAASVNQGKAIAAPYEFESHGWPPTFGPLSTNATCQPEKTENSRENPWPPREPWGFGLHPSDSAFETERTAHRKYLQNVWDTGGSKKALLSTKTGLEVGIAKRLAPRHGFEPRFTAPKAAVLPLDDRGMAAQRFHFSVFKGVRRYPGPFVSAQCEKFRLEQSRKFLFWKREPMGIGTTTGADGIERKRTRSAESAA